MGIMGVLPELKRKINIGQQEVEDLYRDVVKKFPTKEDEIKILYLPSWGGTASYASLNEEETKKEPQIWIGVNFFDSSKGEREGAMAHEIGHHETEKKYSLKRLKRSYKWEMQYQRNVIPVSRPHRKQRLRKRNILDEKAADNKAVCAGYGEQRLKDYKKRISKYSQLGEEKKKRNEKWYEKQKIFAANVEEKLEEKGEKK